MAGMKRFPESDLPSRSTSARRLSPHRNRRASPWAKAKAWITLPEGATPGTEHDAAMGRILLVLFLRFVSAERSESVCGRDGRTVLDVWKRCRQPPAAEESIFTVGGTEHAVLHLLYSRDFWHKVLYDLNYVFDR